MVRWLPDPAPWDFTAGVGGSGPLPGMILAQP
jgi:hypothetical protein